MDHRIISADDHIDMSWLPKDLWQGDRSRDAETGPLRQREAAVRSVSAGTRRKERADEARACG